MIDDTFRHRRTIRVAVYKVQTVGILQLVQYYGVAFAAYWDVTISKVFVGKVLNSPLIARKCPETFPQIYYMVLG